MLVLEQEEEESFVKSLQNHQNNLNFSKDSYIS